jgi:hypothetical protein
MTEEQIQFIKDQRDTIEGQKWLKFLEDYIQGLYNMKGVPLDQVLSRQQAAEHLEKLIVHSKDKTPIPRNNEYK